MNDKKLNCCGTDNSECNTQEANCCTTEKKSIGNKKKAGLGILLIALIFAVASAFTTDDPNEKANCSTAETSCETSCDTESEESNCCSK